MKTKFLLPVALFALSFQTFSEPTKDLSGSTENLSIETEERFPLVYGESKTISQGRYIGGGVASIFLGWGIGHAVQGRYSERGWIFTAGGALSAIGVIGLFSSLTKSALENPENTSLSGADYAFMGALIVGAGIRIWEMIDAWFLPSHYKIVKESSFQIKPLAFYDPSNKFHYGLSLNYKF